MSEKQDIRSDEIYTDLSPTLDAKQALAKKLPTAERMQSDETWHIYFFATEDLAQIRRTVMLACHTKGWREPGFYYIKQFVTRLKEVLPRPEEGKEAVLTRENILKGLKELQEEDNRPWFVVVPPGTPEKDRHVADAVAIMEAYAWYCTMEREKQLSRQIDCGKAQPAKEELPLYHRLFFVLYSEGCLLPKHLQDSMTTFWYPSLTPEDFRSLLWEFHCRKECALQKKQSELRLEAREAAPLKLNQKLLTWYANRMSGLSEIVVRRLLASLDSAFDSGYADYTDLTRVEPYIVQYKNEIVKRHGRAELVQLKDSDGVVGVGNLTQWLDDHKEAIGNYKDSPTGILLVGVPGTGKSATAKEVARKFDLPLVKLEMSRILGKFVGDSEKGMLELLEDLRFLAPCVLWIDEIEKEMSGADGKSDGSGVVQRLFGMLVKFIQENDKPVFIVTTANDISRIPPEFFRNCRFDQTYCLMMPSFADCVDIMELKLNFLAESLGWEHRFESGEAEKVLEQCVGTPEEPRFLTGSDIEEHIKELCWRYEKKSKKECLKLDTLLQDMKEVASVVRAQATPSAPHTMNDLAKRYLDLIRRGLTQASNRTTYFSQKSLRLDPLRYYEYDGKAESELPLCLQEVPEFRVFKDVSTLEKEIPPAKWYDAVFFYTLADAMGEAVIMDPNLTQEYARQNYWKYKAARQKR